MGAGDWVEFADYSPLPDDQIGHPQGMEWFCDQHLSFAQSVSNLPSDEAIKKIREKFGKANATKPLQTRKASLARCIFGFFKSG